MKPWLPKEAFQHCSPEPAFQRVLEVWGGHWLVEGEPSVAAIYQDNCPLLPSSMKWRSIGPISLAWREGAQWALASAMLGHAVIPASLQATDRRLLDALTLAPIEDLARRLAELVPANKNAGEPTAEPIELTDCNWWEICIAPGKPLLKLAMARHALVGLIKAEIPAQNRISLTPLRDGLAQQEVSVAALLGRCRIELGDLKGLGPGDVLILESAAADPVAIAVNDRPSPLRASISGSEHGASFTIVSQG